MSVLEEESEGFALDVGSAEEVGSVLAEEFGSTMAEEVGSTTADEVPSPGCVEVESSPQATNAATTVTEIAAKRSCFFIKRPRTLKFE